MAHAVLIPFQTANSHQHIIATAGGYDEAQVDTLSPLVSKDNVEAAFMEDACKPIITMPGWNKVAPDRIVCADSPNLATVLASLGAGDALYIRGHCAAGSSLLASSDRKATIGISSLVALLDGKLPKTFSGKVKIYACESGASSGAMWWKGESFAKKLSDAMIGEGWNACSYYGYTKELATWVVNGHKRVGADHSKRAKSVRVKVG
jgi:hypothetical protein